MDDRTVLRHCTPVGTRFTARDLSSLSFLLSLISLSPSFFFSISHGRVPLTRSSSFPSLDFYRPLSLPVGLDRSFALSPLYSSSSLSMRYTRHEEISSSMLLIKYHFENYVAKRVGRALLYIQVRQWFKEE